MSKVFRPYEPEQMLLMPVALHEWLPPDHLAYFISDVVDHLDLHPIMMRYEGEERGYPPYHPVMMVKVLLYAYCVGVPSSRKIEKHLREDIAFCVLSANNRPDFRTISDFRKEHLEALVGLFLEVVRLCREAGLVKLGHLSMDGTKMKANASKHKAMSYGRMKEEEARLEAEVRDLLQKAKEIDEEEDRHYGKDKRGDELPRELAFREGRLKKIREAKESLEKEAKRRAEMAKASGESQSEVPQDKAQRNFTDPESRIMPRAGGKEFIQGYNAQAVVDSQSQIIVACEVTDEPSDKLQALPMMEKTRANLGELPREVSADAGYFSSAVIEKLCALGVEPFIPPGKLPHSVHQRPSPRGRIPRALSITDRMRRKLMTKRGRERYALRMKTAEPVYGQIKQGRGFRGFLLRGKNKVRGEWHLICTGHNLMKLFAVWRQGLVTLASRA